MDTEDSIGPVIVVIGFAILAYFVWQHYQLSQVPPVIPSVGPPGTVIYPPMAPPALENVAISSIPVVGPALDYTVIKTGNAIMQNKWLEANSTVGPNPGQTEASAGIAGVTVGKGISYSQAWSDIKSFSGKAQNFVSSGEILEPWKW